jgi:tetratricopeptide (TPR) repeat protein/TolB-like protein
MDVARKEIPAERITPDGAGTLRLVTLGRLALLQSNGEELPLLGHKRKLALLAVLALTPGAINREELIAMFWAHDKNERSRRHSLSNSLSFLRGIIGSEAIETYRAHVTLGSGTLTADAVELLSAAQADDHARVIQLYNGRFLEGVSISGSELFDSWVERQRDVIERAVSRAKDAPIGATSRARDSIGRTLHAAPAALPPTTAQSSVRIGDAAQMRTGEAAHRFTHAWRVLIAVAAMAIVAGIAAYVLLRSKPVVGVRPLIAVTDIVNRQGDTASAWLEDGLPQMISADLSATSAIEMIGPVRVRITRGRARLPLRGALTAAQALELGRRLGASTIVRGEFTHRDGMYMLAISTHDVVSGRPDSHFTVTGTNPMTVAGLAAGRLLDLEGINGNKPRFADVEMNNVAAYQHFVRSLHAESEGRFADSRRELDASIALDSGFATALSARSSIAVAEGDTATVGRLARAMQHARRTQWNTMRDAIDSAMHNGENDRAAQLAAQLVTRYQHDPRAYAVLASIYTDQGDWARAQSTAQQELALDSLANEAGDGPCVPCSAYGTLIQIELLRGDLAAAERAARRWLQLQPDLPVAWAVLADILDYSGRYDAGLDANHRAVMLSGNDPSYEIRTARALIAGRRIGAADSLLSQIHSTSNEIQNGISDVRILALRERGDWSASNAAIEASLARQPNDDGFLLEEMDGLGRMGDYAAASRLFDTRIAPRIAPPIGSVPQRPRGDAARAFSWTRALEANAIAGSGDTVRLHAIADSMRVIGRWSYLDRDRHLYHHVLGLIAMQGKRYTEAEAEFQAARWGAAGWTQTVAWEARAQLAQNKSRNAIATLRQAYEGPLDAMGRYEPHSELDMIMATAFRQAGMRDSAAVYDGYVRSVRGNGAGRSDRAAIAPMS